MRAVTAEQMRALDRRAAAEHGVSGAVLMDRAGHGLARGIRRICEARGLLHPSIRMVAGKGNNGGDVFAAAFHLYRHFADLEIVLVGGFDQLRGETLWHYERVKDQVVCSCLPDPSAWEAFSWYGGADIVVEGLLGTGTSGAPREPVAGAIRAVNQARLQGALVVAVDIPSGLCADTGSVAGDAIVADYTFTMGLPKCGMLQTAAQSWLGHVAVIDIGIRAEWIDEVCEEGSKVLDGYARLEPGIPEGRQLICGADVQGWLPPRARASHKGTFGRVLLIGGAPGFSGAIAMAAKAACCSGAGLVHVLTPAAVADRVAQFVPEAMVHAGAQRADGGLAASALDGLADLRDFDTVLVGPGLTVHPDGAELLHDVLTMPASVVVLDADALPLLASYRQRLLPRPKGALILTPHPGEAGRLLDLDARQVQGDRVDAVQRLAREYGAVVILKGAGTLVSGGGDCWMNLTGNPGMATGGSGDVLGGMVTALGAQGIGALEAACAAVHVHGVAGDLGALAGSALGLTANGLLDALPRAFGWVLGR